MNNQLAIPDRQHTQLPVSPAESPRSERTSLEDLLSMAKVVASSGLIPGLQTQSAVFTLMLICESEGLHPAQALKRYHIIEGRPTMRADAMQADFMRLGGLVRWERSDAEVCSAWFLHPKYAPEPGFQVTVTLAELIESGVATTWNKDKRQHDLKANYKKHPRQMLRARVISEGVRAVHPGVVAGIYAPEELDDYREAQVVNVTAMPVASPAPAPVPVPAQAQGPAPQLEGAAILPAPTDPGFGAKVKAAQDGSLGVDRPAGNGNGTVDYSPPADPAAITPEQSQRLQQLVQGVLKLGREEWQAILSEFGVARAAALSAVDAETILRRLAERADDLDHPFGAGADDPVMEKGNEGSASQKAAGGPAPAADPVAAGAPFVAPGTPTDDDPRVPLINEVLAVVGRLGWDNDQFTFFLAGMLESSQISSQDIMNNTEDELRLILDELKRGEIEMKGDTPGQPADDLVVPEATRPLTKANARAQARASKPVKGSGKDAPAEAPAPAAQP